MKLFEFDYVREQKNTWAHINTKPTETPLKKRGPNK